MTMGTGSACGARETCSAQVTYWWEVAETLRDDARARCAGRGAPDWERPETLRRFRYLVAAALAPVLAAYEPALDALYWCDNEAAGDEGAGEGPAPETTLHLLAVVHAPSVALDWCVAQLDAALCACLRALPAPWLADTASVLELTQVTAYEVEHSLGAASCLGSLHAPPLTLWARPEDEPADAR